MENGTAASRQHKDGKRAARAARATTLADEVGSKLGRQARRDLARTLRKKYYGGAR